MKFDLASIDIMACSEEQKQILTVIRELRLKSQMQGGLVYQDEAVLNNSIKKFQSLEQQRQDIVELKIAEGSTTDVHDKIMEADRRVHGAIHGLIEQLKLLPTDNRDPKEEWTENPRYAAYKAKNPSEYTVVVRRKR